MGAFRILKNLLSSNAPADEKIDNKSNTRKIINSVESQKSIDEKIKTLKRLKYKESDIALENNLEFEILQYLISRESSNFNVYWNLYIPYAKNKYMQIDLMIITGKKIYVLECKEYKTCTNIEEIDEQWLCYYNSGKTYKNVNGVLQNEKHIQVLEKYLNGFSFEYKSIVPMVVANDFKGELTNQNILLVRDNEFDMIFKFLDREIEPERCLECIDERYIKANEQVYKCMNPSEDIVKIHKAYINQRYKEN